MKCPDTPSYKHGFGFSPLVAFLDATGEPLAARLRPGNAAPGNADDHVSVLLAQVHRGLHRARRPFIVGHKLSAEMAAVVTKISKKRWQQAISADGNDERESGEVAEITDLVDLSLWGDGTRMIVRRELPIRAPNSPSAMSRATAIWSSSPTTKKTKSASSTRSIGAGDAANVGSATPKTPDSPTCPRPDSPSTPPWLVLVLIAGDLLVWMKGLCLDGELARADPKRLRYTLLHTAGVLVHSARRTTLRVAEGWPWADDLLTAFTRLPNWSSA